MSKKILGVALAALMLLIVALPAGAQIQVTSLDVRGEVYDNQSNFPVLGTSGTGWDAFNFAGFWYDLKEGLQSESLNITAANTTAILLNGNRNITKQMVFYNTTRQFVRYKVNDANQSNNFVEKGLDATGTKQTSGVAGTHYAKLGWFAEPYVALNGKANKLAKLIIEQGSSSSEKKSLTVGETWDIGDGWTLTAQSIDAKATPRQAWLVLSKDGVKKDDKVIAQGQVYTYIEKSIAGESDVPLFVTYVDSVFAGATSDMVQLRYTWAVSTSITEVKSADKYGILKVTDDGSSLGTIVLWNEDNSISLSTDATIDIGGNMKFKVADNSSYLRFYPMVTIKTPGTYEVRGEVYSNGSHYPAIGTNSSLGTGWTAFNFAGFWYDLKEGLQSESLNINAANTTSILVAGNRNISKQMVFYNTTRQFVRYKVNDANQSNNFVEKGLDASGTKQTSGVAGTHYAKLGWFAEPYVAMNGKSNKLAKLIIEQGSSSSDKKSLTVGETWDIGDGWTLTAQSIDAKATPRQAWLVLSKDGVKKDDKVIAQGQVYTYIEKSIAGESDVPLFVTYVDSVFAGATSDMVQLRYTWA
ncbi:MAG: S-layer protein domain-containing protein, partial [Candidatus Methanoperedens sp.]|nr:S-layer protein domain-containing protein [Candidatus Methanoperedens sp.]